MAATYRRPTGRRGVLLLPAAAAAAAALTLLDSASTLFLVAPSTSLPGSRLAGFPTVAARSRSLALGARGGESEAFSEGDAVEAVFEEDENWYPAVISKDNGDGTYDVKWDDPDGGPEISKCKLEDIKKYVPPIPLDELEIGGKYKGTVVSTAPFGVFVNINAERDGLVHVSAIKDGFVENVDDEVEAGQEVDVWVKGVDGDKLSLVMVESKLQGGRGGGGSRPRADLSPFRDLAWDETIDGEVVSVQNFGAFVSVSPPGGGDAAQGLVHISELGDEFVEDIYSAVEVGQQVRVRVKDVDMDAGKMSLTMKSA